MSQPITQVTMSDIVVSHLLSVMESLQQFHSAEYLTIHSLWSRNTSNLILRKSDLNVITYNLNLFISNLNVKKYATRFVQERPRDSAAIV